MYVWLGVGPTQCKVAVHVPFVLHAMCTMYMFHTHTLAVTNWVHAAHSISSVQCVLHTSHTHAVNYSSITHDE